MTRQCHSHKATRKKKHLTFLRVSSRDTESPSLLLVTWPRLIKWSCNAIIWLTISLCPCEWALKISLFNPLSPVQEQGEILTASCFHFAGPLRCGKITFKTQLRCLVWHFYCKVRLSLAFRVILSPVTQYITVPFHVFISDVYASFCILKGILHSISTGAHLHPRLTVCVNIEL